MLKKQKMAGKLASWFMVVMMVGMLVGCGKDISSTPDTTPDTPVVEADVDTNVDVDTDTNVDVEPNTDTDVESVIEPTQAIYEGLTPAGTGYATIDTADEVNGVVFHGLYTYFVPIDKNEHAAFIGYVGDIIDNGGDYYGAKMSIDDPDDISVYTKGIENCQYAVYFETPSDFIPNASRKNAEAIGGFSFEASSSLTTGIRIVAYPMDAANGDYDWYELYNTPKDYYIGEGYKDVKEYSFEREDGRLVSIVSYLSKNADKRIFYGNFIALDESKLVNEYYVLLQTSLDFSEEDALAIINSVRFMEKDEADELYMSLLHQTAANEYFDPTTIE